MSRMKLFSTAVVLSPGAWQHVIDPDAGNAPVGHSAQRLAALLNSALTFASHALLSPVDLPFDHPQSDDTSVVAQSSPLQLERITPRSGPDFLLIRQPNETAVDIPVI
jgi:hypothetical protein